VGFYGLSGSLVDAIGVYVRELWTAGLATACSIIWALLSSHLKTFHSVPSNIWIYVWSIKYR
jgi:hypothetical protein